MSAFPVGSIAIVGGGPAAWMAAAILARVLGASCRVHVVERASTPGAIASVPSLHRLLKLLAIDERALMRATDATWRLGTRVQGFGALDSAYFQGFGALGVALEGAPFHQHYLRACAAGQRIEPGRLSIAAEIARLGRFAPPVADPRSLLGRYAYAWHFDAPALTKVLRGIALAAGARVTAGEVASVERHAEGELRALVLADGARIEAAFFVDCAGAGGALARSLAVPFEDWSRWLPCDRMQVAAHPPDAALAPSSEIRADAHGWRFRIPLQHSTTHGAVYASGLVDDDAIASGLGPAGADATVVPLARGRPRDFWVLNCLALPGDALEPLETSALHLALTGITRFLAHFPSRPASPPDRDEYNRLTRDEYDRLRDLLVLHYHATAREDSALWRECRRVEPPATLAHRIALFADSGRLTIGEDEHCGLDGWLAVLLGQGVIPHTYDPLADEAPLANLRDALRRLAAEVHALAVRVPRHGDQLQALGVIAPG